MLRIRDVHAGYGATPILFGVSLEVRPGEAVALPGKKGMGKTTLMKTAMGFLKPWRGTIEYDDKILRGVARGDLPIQQPTRLELVVNVRTAGLLGLKVPTSFLARADEVIK